MIKKCSADCMQVYHNICNFIAKNTFSPIHGDINNQRHRDISLIMKMAFYDRCLFAIKL